MALVPSSIIINEPLVTAEPSIDVVESPEEVVIVNEGLPKLVNVSLPNVSELADVCARVIDSIENNLDVPYSCQGGVCSSCIAKLKKGKIEMLENQILTDEEIKDGLVLTCQSIAASDNIIIDYDEV